MVASPSAGVFVASLRLVFFVQPSNLIGRLLPQPPSFRSLAMIGERRPASPWLSAHWSDVSKAQLRTPTTAAAEEMSKKGEEAPRSAHRANVL